jgi:hypothetical protein
VHEGSVPAPLDCHWGPGRQGPAIRIGRGSPWFSLRRQADAGESHGRCMIYVVAIQLVAKGGGSVADQSNRARAGQREGGHKAASHCRE